MKIDVKVTGILQVRKFLGNTDRQVIIAQSRAIRGTLSAIRTLIRRDAAKSLGVAQKHLQKRLLTSTVKNGDTSGYLWAGTWQLSPYAIGKPSQRPKGVIGVPRRSYVGAFTKSIFGPMENIWIRKASKHYRPELYPGGGRRSSGSVPQQLRGRFPIIRAMVEVEPTMEQVFDRDAAVIRAEFDKRLRKEINFALNIEGRA